MKFKLEDFSEKARGEITITPLTIVTGDMWGDSLHSELSDMLYVLFCLFGLNDINPKLIESWREGSALFRNIEAKRELIEFSADLNPSKGYRNNHSSCGYRSCGHINIDTDDEYNIAFCPEAFLHPRNIVAYAGRVVEALKTYKNSGIYIETFSADLLQSLFLYTSRADLDEIVTVLFAEKRGDVIEYRNITDDVEVAFADLAYPIHKIYTEV